MLHAHIIHTHSHDVARYACSLTYADRFLRRKRLQTDCGLEFVLDLDQTTSLNHDDQIELSNGARVAVIAAPEFLAQITGDNLLELAWHIGNRHTPCQIDGHRLLIQHDHVIEHMVKHLGGDLAHITEPFTPLGGAYGHGRTHSHEHGATAHAH